MPNLDNQTIQLALVAAVRAGHVDSGHRSARRHSSSCAKLAKSIREEIEDLRSSVMPVIDNTRDLLARLDAQD